MNVKLQRLALMAFVTAGMLGTQNARASVLFSTGAPIGGDYINAESFTSGVNNGPLADSFSTGAGGFTLGQVDLNLGAGTGTGTVSVALYSDNSTFPGAVLASLGSIAESSIVGATGVYSFSAFTPISLAANTRYWIELTSTDTSASPGASAMWNYAVDDTGTDAGSTNLSGEYFVNSNTSAASNVGTYPNGSESDTNGPYVMTLSSLSTSPTSAPEPATLGILGIGMAGIRLVRRRRT